MKRMIARVSDRLLQGVAPKTTAGAICSGWYYCCTSSRKAGLRRKDPNYGNWCTPCYPTNQSC